MIIEIENGHLIGMKVFENSSPTNPTFNHIFRKYL